MKKDIKGILLIIVFLYGIISYFAIDKRFFAPLDSSNFFTYIMCKFIFLALIFGLFYWCCYIFCSWATRKNEYVRSMLVALPVILVYLVMTRMLIGTKWYEITSGDLGLIYESSKKLVPYYDFHFLTTWFYIIASMIVPKPNFIIWFKTILIALSALYFANRIIKRAVIRYSDIVLYWIAFSFIPVIETITNCHRIHIYIVFYVFFLTYLLIDYIENRTLSKYKAICLVVVAAMVTQWRVEGIVVSILFIPLVFFVYKIEIKKLVKIFVLLVAANLIIFIPQTVGTFSSAENYSDVRMHPLYSYKITMMLKEGLDREANEEDLNKINRVISIEAIDRLNNDLGDNTYADGYIRWLDGYVGVRDLYVMDYYRAYEKGEIDSSYGGFGSEEYMDYVIACKNIFRNNPVLYIKTSFNTLKYVEKSARNDDRSLLRRIVPNVVVTFEYSTIFSIIILCIIILYNLKNNLPISLIALILLGQAFIVFVMSPGGYYKYYMPVTTMTWVLVVCCIGKIIEQKVRKNHKG